MARTKSRARSPGANLLLVVLLVLLGGAATIGTLALLGRIDVANLWSAQAAQRMAPADRTGKVAVIVATRPIPRFRRVTQADLVDPKTGTIRESWMDEDKAKSSGFLTRSDVVGRVMAKVKLPGYPFLESELLPAGAQDNWTSGVPEGMRGMTIGIERVQGLDALKEGDRFDLIAVRAADKAPKSSRDVYVSPGASESARSQEGWLATSRTIVHGAEVIVAAAPPPPPGTKGRREPREVKVAVPELEVAELTQALALEVEITAIVGSGRPDVALTQIPDPPAPEPSAVIQILSGVDSHRAVVPAGKPDPDQDTSEGDGDEATPQKGSLR
jgi:Flp pilus assembly protein CpaB